MKCYKKLFCKTGILYNIGFYIILLTSIALLIAVIIFYLKDYKIIINNINNIENVDNNMKIEDLNKNLEKKEKIKQIDKKRYKKKEQN